MKDFAITVVIAFAVLTLFAMLFEASNREKALDKCGMYGVTCSIERTITAD